MAIFVYDTLRTDSGAFNLTLTDTDGSAASTKAVDSSYSSSTTLNFNLDGVVYEQPSASVLAHLVRW